MTSPRLAALSLLAGLTVLLSAVPGHAEEAWAKYESPEYGFSMLVPAGATMVEQELGEGWGQLWAEHDGVKLYAVAKLGVQADAAEIEKIGVRVTDIPAAS